MSLFAQIVSEEKLRIEKMIFDYEQELLSLPKGTLVCKSVKSNRYYYLQYRKGKKTVSSYVGGDKDKVDYLRERINRRKHIESMLKTLRIEYVQAKKLIGV